MDNKVIDFVKSNKYKNEDDILKLFQECFFIKIEGSFNFINNNSENFFFKDILLFDNKFKLKPILYINLSDIQNSCDFLPKNGYLVFFISVSDLGYRFPYSKNEYSVYFSEDYSLIDKYFDVKSFNLSFTKNLSFPSYQEYLIEELNIVDFDVNPIDDIEDFIELNYLYDVDVNHQICGHPLALQGTVRFWWALNYFGYSHNDLDNLSHDIFSKVKNEEKYFMLLLQVNLSDDNLNFGIYQDSVAYFGIHQKDLVNRDFSKTVLIMQNT